MTNDQIRLHFGELNADEMRLARAIVGWHEREQAKLRAAADGLAEALERIRQGCQEDIDSWRDYPQHRGAVIGGIGGNKAIAEAALTAYQATKKYD